MVVLVVLVGVVVVLPRVVVVEVSRGGLGLTAGVAQPIARVGAVGGGAPAQHELPQPHQEEPSGILAYENAFAWQVRYASRVGGFPPERGVGGEDFDLWGRRACSRQIGRPPIEWDEGVESAISASGKG